VFAVGPTLRVVNGPALNAQGNWVWNVSIQPSFDDSPIAAELGFDANSAIVSATKGAAFTGANTDNPGEVIFGWEDLTALGGTGTCGSASPGNCPVGVLWAANDTPTNGSAPNDQLFAALGSIGDIDIATQAGFLTIVTEGPTNTALTGNVAVSGAYGAGGNEGRIAELTSFSPGPPPTGTSANYKNYTGTATRTIVNGDITLNGVAGDEDFAIFGGQYSSSPTAPKVGGWNIGDFNRDGQVNDADFAIFGGAYNPAAAPGGSTNNLTAMGVLDPPAGAGGGGAVPEPTSLALCGLALLAGLGLIRRR
jgi:hypothetical protein